jgi:transcriptional regulator with XRE-family HTH domain
MIKQLTIPGAFALHLSNDDFTAWHSTVERFELLAVELPRVLTFLRVLEGQSQVEVAQATGLKLSRIGDLENDKGDPLTLDEAGALLGWITTHAARFLATPLLDELEPEPEPAPWDGSPPMPWPPHVSRAGRRSDEVGPEQAANQPGEPEGGAPGGQHYEPPAPAENASESVSGNPVGSPQQELASLIAARSGATAAAARQSDESPAPAEPPQSESDV